MSNPMIRKNIMWALDFARSHIGDRAHAEAVHWLAKYYDTCAVCDRPITEEEYETDNLCPHCRPK